MAFADTSLTDSLLLTGLQQPWSVQALLCSAQRKAERACQASKSTMSAEDGANLTLWARFPFSALRMNHRCRAYAGLVMIVGTRTAGQRTPRGKTDKGSRRQSHAHSETSNPSVDDRAA